jgi:ectoine hydroxylase-related dioxygenase (phytanoyl-CoA dioxygenase family)
MYYKRDQHSNYDLDAFAALRFEEHSHIEDLKQFIKTLADMSKHFLFTEHHSPETVWMFNDQYIVKPPLLDRCETQSEFGWHQDSAYLEYFHPMNSIATVSCWIALDDMNFTNGTLKMQPYQQSSYDFFNNDLDITHYHFQRKQEPLLHESSSHEILQVQAGSIVWIAPFVWHTSHSNQTNHYRRVYMPQFSSAPLIPSNLKDLRISVEIKS